jgi:hypothetical protein
MHFNCGRWQSVKQNGKLVWPLSEFITLYGCVGTLADRAG